MQLLAWWKAVAIDSTMSVDYLALAPTLSVAFNKTKSSGEREEDKQQFIANSQFVSNCVRLVW